MKFLMNQGRRDQVAEIYVALVYKNLVLHTFIKTTILDFVVVFKIRLKCLNYITKLME